MTKLSPSLTRLRKICLSLPDAEEGTAWGHPVFRVAGRMFCVYEEIKGTWTVGFKMAPLHAMLHEGEPRIVAAQSLGKHRWLFMDAARIHDWDEVRDAIMASYGLAAPKRSLAKLSAAPPPPMARR